MIDSPIKLLKYFCIHINLVSSASAVKQVVKFSNTPMQSLRKDLEKVFSEHKLNFNINSATDDNLSYDISNGSLKTFIELNRHRHKPLEVEILADHKMHSAPDYVKRRRQSNNGNNSRLLWYGIILFGFIIYMLLTFVSVLIALIEALTPGWSSVQRVIGIFAFTTLIVFYWMYVIPYFRRQKERSVFTLNTQIVALIKVKLDAIFEEQSKNSVVRCWSCFKEIQMGDEFCEHCGKAQA